MVSESPRWLFRRGRIDAARISLLRSRTVEEANVELKEMEETIAAERAQGTVGQKAKESLLHRKYVIPFVLACVILFCNTATGINSIIGYNTNILLQADFGPWSALGLCVLHVDELSDDDWRVMLVDRKGRKFLLLWARPGLFFRWRRLRFSVPAE